MTRRTLFIASSALALIGCGDLADESTSSPPLATITGTLTLASGTTLPDEQLRVALLWNTLEAHDSVTSNADGCGPKNWLPLLAEQQVTLTANFPSQFVLDLTEPPPPDALEPFPGDEDKLTGSARIFVYTDGNENGTLDVRVPGEPAADVVLATSMGDARQNPAADDVFATQVVYFSEPHYFEDEHGVQDYVAGYNLAHQEYLGGFESAPIDTPIDLRLTAAPYLQDLLCETMCVPTPTDFECPASPADLPQAPAGATEYRLDLYQMTGADWAEGPGGHASLSHACDQPDIYTWSRTTCQDCSCESDTCFYQRADVPAADWPCE